MPPDLLQWITATFGEGAAFWAGYLTNGKHLTWYASVGYTLTAALLGALFALGFGLVGATLRNSGNGLLSGIGTVYISMVRGVPDVLFFLFFPLAFEQFVELIASQSACSPADIAANAGVWPPCPAANWRLGTPEYLLLACVALGILYGASTANVISGAMRAVPRGQLEAARAFGMSNAQVLWRIHIRQMWIYALPGLSNVWMLLIKSTSLLSLLQIADIVLWADRLGAPNYVKTAGLVHPDWRWAYYMVLIVFYILLTFVSEKGFGALTRWASKGMVLGSAT